MLLHDDTMRGTAEGLTVARVGWLPTRGRFVVLGEDSVEPGSIGDARAVLRYCGSQGWMVTGRSPP